MDTQWPRYEVFQQERAGQPHRNAGAVHAPDDEIALELARDVFVRRPNCLSLWVIPESAIFARTVEELEEEAATAAPDTTDAPLETYLVFQKQGQTARETYVAHAGSVEGRSPTHALQVALATLSHENVFVWWLAPARRVVQSDAGDAASWFEPAQGKRYRNHLAYPVEPIMRELKSAAGLLDPE